MKILKYSEARDYNHILQSVIEENWQSFFEERKEEYKKALEVSVTYVIYDNEKYCGYIRGLTDGLFTLFIAELIIDSNSRKKGYGKMLIEYVQSVFPSTRIDLISDEDEFYNKIGFKSLGTGMRRHNWY